MPSWQYGAPVAGFGPCDFGDHQLAAVRPRAISRSATIDVDNATYFISKITIVRRDDPGMARWRKKLFLGLSRLSASPVGIFHLPEQRIVTMGSYIEL